MTDATAAAILAELQAVRRLLEALQPPALDQRQRDLLTALRAVYGVATPFSAAEVITVSRSALSTRRPLRQALQALGVADSAQRLGMALADIARRSAGADLRLQRLKSEAGRALWAVNL